MIRTEIDCHALKRHFNDSVIRECVGAWENHLRSIASATGQLLISSIKEEVKKKHISFGRNFSCFSAHLIERDVF
jgi:hypothetical protein